MLKIITNTETPERYLFFSEKWWLLHYSRKSLTFTEHEDKLSHSEESYTNLYYEPNIQSTPLTLSP